MKKNLKLLAVITALLLSMQATAAFADNDKADTTEKAETVTETVTDPATDDTTDKTTDDDTAKDDTVKDDTVKDDVADTKKDDNDKNGIKDVIDKITGNKKFNKDELKAKIEEFKAQKLELKEYCKAIKEKFAEADKEARKEILAEIAKAKQELKDYSIGVFAGGKEIDFEKYDNVLPRIKNECTLVPIRAITESLGATVEWDDKADTITITKGDNVIVLQIGINSVIVNGTELEIEAAPEIENGRTLVPLRVVSEALKNTVEWDEDSQTIVVDDDEDEETAADETKDEQENTAEKEDVSDNTETPETDKAE